MRHRPSARGEVRPTTCATCSFHSAFISEALGTRCCQDTPSGSHKVWEDCTPTFFRNQLITKRLEFWRRGESNPRPKSAATRSLHAYLNSVCDPVREDLSRVRPPRSE